MSTARQELESEWRPTDMVLAVLEGPEQSEAAVGALQQAGFTPDDIAVLRGQEAVETLDIEGKRSSGGFARTFKAVWSYFSVEGPELRPYEEASEAGHDIIAVKVSDDDRVATVTEVLNRFDASEMKYFTQWNVSELPKD